METPAGGPLLWAVRILLECIVVVTIIPIISIGTLFSKHILYQLSSLVVLFSYLVLTLRG